MSKKNRVIAYVDGFNLYFGMKYASLDADKAWVTNGGSLAECIGRSLYWLDLRAVFLQQLKRDDELVGIKYFTAPRRVSKNVPPANKVDVVASNARQQIYINALEATEGVNVILGKYLEKPASICPSCKHKSPRWEEKMTDVAIAVQLMQDAYTRTCDQALVMSADSDLVPAVEAIRKIGMSVKLILSPGRKKASGLQQVASDTMALEIADMRDKRLPDCIDRSARQLPPVCCPNEWKVPGGWCWEEPPPLPTAKPATIDTNKHSQERPHSLGG